MSWAGLLGWILVPASGEKKWKKSFICLLLLGPVPAPCDYVYKYCGVSKLVKYSQPVKHWVAYDLAT